MRAARAVAGNRAGPLREAVEALRGALVAAYTGLELPLIDSDDEDRWSLVRPVSQAVRAADAILAQHPRSPRQLDRARERLAAAASAVQDPAAFAGRDWLGRAGDLPVVVPGPDGTIPVGVIDCERESGGRVVRWYPDGWHQGGGELLSVAAGRSPDYRYRFTAKRVWEDLAHDLIVVCCGWRTDPKGLPPTLARARHLLARQLREDLGAGTWTLEPVTVVRWLEAAHRVSVFTDNSSHVMNKGGD